MIRVFWNDQALYDLEDCIDSLMFPQNPNRPPLTFEEAIDYRNDIMSFADSLRERTVHADCAFAIHKIYGEKVARYDRNKSTQYYIVYNLDLIGNIYVERIITNHITII